MINKIFLFCTFTLLVLSGCTFTQSNNTETVCGNNVVESGEECDASSCSTGKVCQECKCVALSPPTLPE